jgi:hypothetical protein
VVGPEGVGTLVVCARASKFRTAEMRDPGSSSCGSYELEFKL